MTGQAPKGSPTLWRFGAGALIVFLTLASCNAAVLVPVYLRGETIECLGGSNCSSLANSSLQQAIHIPIPLIGLLVYALLLYRLLVTVVILKPESTQTTLKFIRAASFAVATTSVGLVLYAHFGYNVSCLLCNINAGTAVVIFATSNLLAEFVNSESVRRPQATAGRFAASITTVAILVSASAAYGSLLPPAAMQTRAYWGQLSATVKPEEIVGDASPHFGSPEAPIKVVAFTDAQCPVCTQLVPWLIDQAEQSLNGKIEVYYRHYPLHMHPLAKPLARLAIWAELNGKFGELRRHIEGATESPAQILDRIPLKDGEKDRILLAVSGNEPLPDVEAVLSKDVSEAEKLGLTGTPYFVILAPGKRPEWILGGAIKERLARAVPVSPGKN